MNESVNTADGELRRIAALAVLTILCFLPFSDKAFHIDDPFYLWVAEQIHEKPLDFYGFDIFWTGSVAPAWLHNKNPPGTSYFIALAATLVGWGERGLHLAFLIPAVGAIVGTYFLAKRMCRYPFVAALTALATPVFMISGTQVMRESLLLCFWVWGVYLWVNGIDHGRISLLFASASMIAVACLIKYPGVNLIPLLFAYSLVCRRSVGWSAMALMLPVCALAAYDMYTASLYGRGHFSEAMSYVPPNQDVSYSHSSLTALVFLGGCISPVLFYLPWLFSGRQLLLIGVVTLLAIAGVPFLGTIKGLTLWTDEGVQWFAIVPIGVFACAGGLILGLTTGDLWKSRDRQSLLLWLWVVGVFTFAGFVNWSVNGRSILPLVPAASIVLMRRIAKEKGLFTFRKPSLQLLAVVPAVAFAFLPTYGDYAVANSARAAANEIREVYGREGQRLWFRGHWGFQWYIQSMGALPLAPRVQLAGPGDRLVRVERESPLSKLRSGDLVAFPQNNANVHLFIVGSPHGSSRYLRLGPAESQVEISELRVHKFPVSSFSTVSRFDGAAFYSDIFGPLPFTAGPMRPETYYVVRIR